MFGLYFGNYLLEKNILSQSQFESITMEQQKTRVKLGLIAVAEKLLTTRQADEINEIQRRMDQRFGDIAVEKGYLKPVDVAYLLNMQGNPYLQFVQVITENNILTLQEIENFLDEFKAVNNFSDSSIDALKSGDIDRIIPIFIDVTAPFADECIRLSIRNIVRFIHNNIVLKKSYKVNEYSYGSLAYQQMVGDHQLFVGIAATGNELLAIANPFAKEAFTEINEDSFDSVCEFINCINGLYASKLSHEDINIDMTPPLFSVDKKMTSTGEIYVVPIMVNGEQVELIVVTDSPVVIQ